MKVFVKSVWGKPHEKWAALSFGREGIANAFAATVKAEDVIFLIGTSGRETDDPGDRGAILGAVSVAPGSSYRTEDIVDREYYRDLVDRVGHNWDNSIPALKMWTIQSRPIAREIIPTAYRKLGGAGIGRTRSVDDRGEIETLLSLKRDEVLFQVRDRVKNSRTDKESIEGQLLRAAISAQNRINNSGKTSSRTSPIRWTSEDILQSAKRALEEQGGLCYLCDQPLLNDPPDGFQISLDRPDSGDPDYAHAKPAHLRCNFAANKWGWKSARGYFHFVRTGKIPGSGDTE